MRKVARAYSPRFEPFCRGKPGVWALTRTLDTRTTDYPDRAAGLSTDRLLITD